MTSFRLSIRGLMVAVVVVGFDIAAWTRAVRFARAGHAGIESALGVMLIFLGLQGVLFLLYRNFTKRFDGSLTKSLRSTSSPLVTFGVYAAMISLAALLILFFTSGLF